MIAILLVGLLACASAAPRLRQHHSALSPFDGSLQRFQNEQMFDTNRFWDEWTRNFNQEMMQMETRLSDFNKHFPSMRATERIEGNEYRITIPLPYPGIEEKDIDVTARKGGLVIRAVNSGGNIFLDVRSLPMFVGEQCSWSYENGVLQIVLPVVQSSESGSKEVTPAAVTPMPDRSREETENPVYADGDIDLARGDLDKTNELPKVEAITSASKMAVGCWWFILLGLHCFWINAYCIPTYC